LRYVTQIALILRGLTLIIPYVQKQKNRPVGRFLFALFALSLPDPACPNSDCALMANNKDKAKKVDEQEVGRHMFYDYYSANTFQDKV
jgi:hypothetical protein